MKLSSRCEFSQHRIILRDLLNKSKQFQYIKTNKQKKIGEYLSSNCDSRLNDLVFLIYILDIQTVMLHTLLIIDNNIAEKKDVLVVNAYSKLTVLLRPVTHSFLVYNMVHFKKSQ